ncbi:YIEGIA family protein [Clostridium sp. D2Q-11]|uniref:YIEGIA family protein n=1 Tax=Anaeromonas frigoriresistens TaxID=2683708 RepID=A0A942ZAE1_9FIRM|nr:YIEGIA family protein [Anaeromonas frigoriresistens]MBS4539705.1 YIEGIA family protein [Anaeromonas frigoriresistens]
MIDYGYIIVPSFILGFLSRLSMLRIDYRQYPSYPQAAFSHITLGAIAASLGALAIPAIAAEQYSAVTFLSLAAQQFRDVRNLERQSLDNIEPTELIPRGTAYIEDIAKSFEARNYVSMITSVLVSISIFSSSRFGVGDQISVLIGVIIGIAVIIYLNKKIKRSVLGEIADVKEATISFDGPLLLVNGIVIMNVGFEDSREIYIEKGIAVEIIPKDENGLATIANVGQRQAITHEAAAQLGIRKDVDEPDFTPMIRRNSENGNLVLSIVALEPDVECLIEIVKSTLVLESAKRKPLASKYGKKAAD